MTSVEYSNFLCDHCFTPCAKCSFSFNSGGDLSFDGAIFSVTVGNTADPTNRTAGVNQLNPSGMKPDYFFNVWIEANKHFVEACVTTFNPSKSSKSVVTRPATYKLYPNILLIVAWNHLKSSFANTAIHNSFTFQAYPTSICAHADPAVCVGFPGVDIKHVLSCNMAWDMTAAIGSSAVASFESFGGSAISSATTEQIGTWASDFDKSIDTFIIVVLCASVLGMVRTYTTEMRRQAKLPLFLALWFVEGYAAAASKGYMELEQLTYSAYAAQCATAGVACVVRRWSQQHPAMHHAFSWEGLRSTCDSMEALTGRYTPRSRSWAQVEDTETTTIGEFMDKMNATQAHRLTQSRKQQRVGKYVFDESLTDGCPAMMLEYVVPFVAVNDLLHRAGIKSSRTYEVLFDNTPSLFVQGRGSRCGLHIDAGHSHFLQVLHRGRKEWTLELLNGTVVKLTTDEGDLMTVPADMPHAVRQLEDCIATSINWVDSTNWKEARQHPQFQRLPASVLAHIDMLQQADETVAGTERLVQESISWREWEAGRGAELFISAPHGRTVDRRDL